MAGKEGKGRWRWRKENRKKEKERMTRKGYSGHLWKALARVKKRRAMTNPPRMSQMVLPSSMLTV